MRAFCFIVFVFLSSCTKPKHVLHFDQAKALLPQTASDTESSAARLPGRATAFLYSDSPEIQSAVSSFRKTGKAPILKNPGFLTYPFGESEPVIKCQPLRACDVELEAGEEILGIALGDTVRWEVMTIHSGAGVGATPHLVIKPREFGISTNLVVSTNKRTYHLALVSDQADYVRQFKFYYPNELIAYAVSKDKIRRKKEAELERTTLASMPSLSASDLNFNYKIKSGRKVRFKPLRVYDDGKKVYIQMPVSLSVREAPILMVKRRNSSEANLVNYRVKNNFYIVDRLFDEAMLLLGVGSRQQKIRIIRNG